MTVIGLGCLSASRLSSNYGEHVQPEGPMSSSNLFPTFTLISSFLFYEVYEYYWDKSSMITTYVKYLRLRVSPQSTGS